MACRVLKHFDDSPVMNENKFDKQKIFTIYLSPITSAFDIVGSELSKITTRSYNVTPYDITDPNNTTGVGVACKVYKRRWIILMLFALCSACNASHWIQYSIITNVVIQYYNVSSLTVDLTSIIFMAAYIPLVFPASWLLQKKGLRVAVILGSFLLAIGSWIKVYSTSPTGFPIAFVGQSIVGISQMFTLGSSARLAAVWFPHHQVSTATALGVFGNQLGIAVGFLIPPLVVHEGGDNDTISKEFYLLHLSTAAVASVIFILICFFFEGSPKLPPSKAQKLLLKTHDSNMKEDSFMSSLKRVFKNPDFDLLLASYGFNIGAFYAYSTLLSQLILSHFSNANEDAGAIGLTLIIGGIIGSVVWGIVLDKTHIYKGTTVIIYCLAILGMMAFTYSLENEMMVFLYVTSAFLGFFMNGYLTIGYEFGAELTYPESEATSSGLLNASGELCGVISVIISGVILKEYGPLYTNLTLVGMLIIGLILSVFINGSKLLRLAASHESNYSLPIK